MANRRIAKGSRTVKKKKLKLSRKESLATPVAAAKAKRKASAAGSTRALSGGGKRVEGQREKRANPARVITSLEKQRSSLIKKHAAERMVLKEHMRDLEARKDRIKRGEHAKTERRELAKYIRQLKQEQQVKHASELANVEEELKRLIAERTAGHASKTSGGNEEDDDWEDVDDGDMDEAELLQMFAHLTV